MQQKHSSLLLEIVKYSIVSFIILKQSGNFGTTTIRIMTLRIITLSKMTRSKISLSIMSFNITTLSLEILNIRLYIMTLGITKNKTLSITKQDTQHNDNLQNGNPS